jgi:hypothetical protein
VGELETIWIVKTVAMKRQ